METCDPSSDEITIYQEQEWSAPNQMAIEFETADFLYGLVRLVKPQIVVETGCYEGFSTRAIAAALRENQKGFLWTCDTNLEKVSLVNKMAAEEDHPFIFAVTSKGVDLLKSIKYVDIVFLDSGGDRAEEAKIAQVKKGGFLVIHDARRNYEVPSNYVKVFFATPRGLALYQKI